MERVRLCQHRAFCLLIVLGGFGLRLYRLGAQSLGYDETVSAYLARQDIPSLVAHTAGDIHPPGYYILLHLWARLAGDGEFALAFFSVLFGTLLIPLTYVVARRLVGRQAALWSALLVALSPFGVWYSQEVRMYSLGAVLGLLALWFVLAMVEGHRRATIGYVLASAIGLYVLYYHAFLLVALNLLLLSYLLHRRLAGQLRDWILAQAAILLLYVPWLPIAWRQIINPPVPPWRGLVALPDALRETWTALAFGQSVQAEQVWPLLSVVGALFLIGLLYPLFVRPSGSRAGANRQQWPGHVRLAAPAASPNPSLLLATYTFGPLALIYLVTPVTPLYHVRYVFTFAPPFYILVGAGLAWLMLRARSVALVGVAAMLAGSVFSIYHLHTDPRYASDDLRAAVRFIAERWRPGDAIVINAGYAYTAFVYYYRDQLAGRMRLVDYHPMPGGQRPLVLQTGIIGGDSSLGWGDAASDFYPTTEVATAAALTRLLQDYPRLWTLRVYDTVADPGGFVRNWLAERTTPFEDRAFAGPSYVRVQGFMSPQQPAPPSGSGLLLAGDMALLGWQMPPDVGGGGPLDVVLWWQATGPLPSQSSPYAVSLKLRSHAGGQGGGSVAAQRDEWPVGSLLFTPEWPVGAVIRHPMRVSLPPDLPPGIYQLDAELYDSTTVQPFPRLDGRGSVIALGSARIAGPAVAGE